MQLCCGEGVVKAPGAQGAAGDRVYNVSTCFWIRLISLSGLSGVGLLRRVGVAAFTRNLGASLCQVLGYLLGRHLSNRDIEGLCLQDAPRGVGRERSKQMISVEPPGEVVESA